MASDSSTYDPHAAAAALVTVRRLDYDPDVYATVIGDARGGFIVRRDFFDALDEAEWWRHGVRRELATALAAAHAAGAAEEREACEAAAVAAAQGYECLDDVMDDGVAALVGDIRDAIRARGGAGR